MPQVSILIRRVSLLASLFLLVCHLLSCNGTGGPATDPITLEVDSTNIGKVHFVIDNSGSMKGYVAVCDSICFKQQISDLLSRLDGIQKDSLGDFISLYTTSGKGSFEAYPGGIADFSIALSSPSEGLMGSHNSYLHITLDSLINKLEQDSILNEVGIFVTDGILSVPGKVNNKEYLPALSSQIQISLNRVKSKGYAVSIFQLFSEFQGSYWNFKNDRQQIQEVVQRPYYLVVLGNAKVLKKFYEEIIKPSLRDEINNQVSWQGKSQDSSIHYQVYSRVLQGTGVPSKDQKGLDQINFADNPPIFLVGLNGFAAPEYILQDSMLVKHLQGKPKIFIDTLEVFNRESFSEVEIHFDAWGAGRFPR